MFKMKQIEIINNILLFAFGTFILFSLVGCKTKQPTNENLTSIGENRYFFIGASPCEIGKQIYKNFLWANVHVSDREFEGKVYVRFFVNYKNDFFNITILTKTNSPSIDAELMRCVKLIKMPHSKINKKAIIEVIAFVSF